jgi:hypothetical protein
MGGLAVGLSLLSLASLLLLLVVWQRNEATQRTLPSLDSSTPNPKGTADSTAFRFVPRVLLEPGIALGIRVPSNLGSAIREVSSGEIRTS